MKCDMDSDGKITIKPVDNVESYALKSWTKEGNSGDITVKTDMEKEPMGFGKKAPSPPPPPPKRVIKEGIRIE